MWNNIFAFDEATARKIAAFIRAGKLKAAPAEDSHHRYRQIPDVVKVVECTSVTQDADDYYPGKIIAWNVDDLAYDDEAVVKLLDIRGDGLTTTNYLGHVVGYTVADNKLVVAVQPDPDPPNAVADAGNTAGQLSDNGQFCFQRHGSPITVTSTSGAITACRWWIEPQNNGVQYDAIAGGYSTVCCGARYTKTGSTGRWMLVQWIKNCPISKFYQNQLVNFQCALKASGATFVNIGFIYNRNGADSITAPLVTSWAGTIPTLASGLQLESREVVVSSVVYLYNGVVDFEPTPYDNIGICVFPSINQVAGSWIEITEAYLYNSQFFVTPHPRRTELDDLYITPLMGMAPFD